MSLARVADEPTREEWRQLYEAALAYREHAPWQWLSDADLFGVRDPASGEFGWCSVFGAAGEPIETIGTRPRVVLTKGDHVLDALGPLAAALEIRVERARRLPALEQARRSMESFLQRR